ncbi:MULTISPECIES: hypothetical protein [Lacticaseibacillus]|uniref:Uncharacterized protein n=2 Tax=Lacticaseibacillus TaxID=2759736 RepID=A0AAN1F0U7_LACCA|nr:MULTISPECIES: hypothetical protein [Lacticaseibacillus]ARY92700.1 hypothetical protein BGL52_13405 [Lacticaseibacillus casei]KAB1969458.1 hypothetical protein F9B82_07880 [Lacticaseibacillus casei]WLV80602.1 hypothetical protein LACSTY_002690 [Lacticaseibacillus sp. NCIMB 15473]WNX24562.1 hypothetical protein RWA15_13175 [Lacticaseibacillus casei]WNX27334.1 hypothetical protein RWA16_13175 [Lacticaseibacillus casei]
MKEKKKMSLLGLFITILSGWYLIASSRPIAVNATSSGLETSGNLTPKVSASGITGVEGTSDSSWSLLANASNTQDVNFIKSDNAYFQYDYKEPVTVAGIRLTGWWPNGQGVSNVTFASKSSDGTWHMNEPTSIRWASKGAGPETLQVALKTILKTQSYRIYINAANHSWGSKITMHQVQPIVQQSQDAVTAPEVTVDGLTLTAGTADNLVNNPEHHDIDLVPSSGQNSIVYQYEGSVYVDSLNLIGWFPQDQGVKTLTIQYEENGTWKDAGNANIHVPWKTPAGQAKEEPLSLALKNPIIASKFRIVINDYFASFGKKISMKLLAPNPTRIGLDTSATDMTSAYRLIQSFGLVGTAAGEFQTQAMADFVVDGQKIIEKLNVATDDQQTTLKQQFEDEVVKLSGTQPDSEAELSLQNANLSEITPLKWLADQQLGTFVDLTSPPSAGTASVILKLKNNQSVSSLTVNVPDQKFAPNHLQIFAKVSGSWQSVYDDSLTWSSDWFDDDSVAGQKVLFSSTVNTNELRVDLPEGRSRISELDIQ